jgi:hypothetical protein
MILHGLSFAEHRPAHVGGCCAGLQSIEFHTSIKVILGEVTKIKSVMLVCAIVVMSACGGTSPLSPSSSSSAISKASAAPVAAPSSSIQATVNGVVSALVGAINTTKNGSQKKSIAPSAGLTDRALFVQPRFITTCNANTGVCQVNESFDQREGCESGGYASLTSSLTGSINANGGNLNWSSHTSLVDCSSNGWVTNSSPYLSAGGTIGVFANHTTLNLTLGGGFLVTNAPGTPNGKSECHFSGVLLQWDSTSGTWSNSGSVICTPGGTFKF